MLAIKVEELQKNFKKYVTTHKMREFLDQFESDISKNILD